MVKQREGRTKLMDYKRSEPTSGNRTLITKYDNSRMKLGVSVELGKSIERKSTKKKKKRSTKRSTTPGLITNTNN